MFVLQPEPAGTEAMQLMDPYNTHTHTHTYVFMMTKVTARANGVLRG